MVLSEIRGVVLGRRVWRVDASPEALADVNRAINDALRQLSGDCPDCLYPDNERVDLYPDFGHGDMGRRARVTVDPYVLNLGVLLTGYTVPAVDGTWDGLMHIEARGADGKWRRRQCREFWIDTEAKAEANAYLVSLDRPWPNTTDTALEYRIYQPEVYFGPDVSEVVEATLWDDVGQHPLRVVAGSQARAAEDLDYRGEQRGIPEQMVRSRQYQLPAPLRAPVAGTDDGQETALWLGPEPMGVWRFAYSYVWGRRDPEQIDPFGGYDPLWESALSPLSAAVTISDVRYRVRLTGLVNIAHQLNYQPSPTTVRNGRTGIRKRIYALRDSVSTVGSFVEDIESPAVPLALTEVRDDVTSATWNGSIVPNYTRRAPEVVGYTGWMLLPHADGAYAVDAAVRRRHPRLLNDQDTSRVAPEAEEALLTLACANVAHLDKQYDVEATYRAAYITEHLPALRRVMSAPAPIIHGRPWTARLGGGYRRGDLQGTFNDD